MRNIKLVLQYDGTAYHGWQTQENAPTVQDTVSRAIQRITGAAPKLTGSSRTDSGVHAKRYVCSFKTESNIPCERLPMAINTYLPDDIVCLDAAECAEDFSARFSARGKCYTYYILDSRLPDAFLRRFSWHFPHKLDIENMKKAAAAFVGVHDFAGFAASGADTATTVREIYSLDVEKRGELIEITVRGNGFLYNMVRIIAGTLAFVGSGKIAAADIPGIIESRDRTRAGITAPPHGLFLTEVYYDE